MRRSRPAYRAGVWLYRLAFVVAAVYVLAMATHALPVLSGPSLAFFPILYLACLVAGQYLFAQVGMRIFALALVRTDGPVGNSDEVRAHRRTVFRDVFGRGR
ncbi:hypothetical protein ACWT_3823 [Actinoplanes sp. SE50]|nr:hypothetical protein ACPL_3952 [Actinoplanes sp. SE50/110]ATO83238.1 hypothetical protein ACWT_3823 [Actinoplanes sp. SE50]SLM00645.1 uncharacterized protein ACSP50_3878 [Actinoplanes sp. SE50/110]